MNFHTTKDFIVCVDTADAGGENKKQFLCEKL